MPKLPIAAFARLSWQSRSSPSRHLAQLILDKGAQAEMCQVSMKLFDKPLDKLAKGFKPTAHPVAVKRIADLQREGYIYIKP